MVVARTMVCAALVLSSLALAAEAGEPRGAVPRSTQTAMGFGAAIPLSDSDGLQVRGTGSLAIGRVPGDRVVVRPVVIVAGPGQTISFGFSVGYAR
jgi:hypothetical protein